MTVTDPATIHQTFAAAVNAGDLERLVALFDEGAVVVERSGERTSGTGAIRDHLQQLIALEPTMRIEDTRSFANGDTALLCSHWTAEATGPDGRAVSLDFRGAEVARRDAAGAWRLYIDNPWGIELID